MQLKEYLTVKEVSKLNKMTARNVRKRIASIEPTLSKELLYKDNKQEWLIHHLIVPKLMPIRVRKQNYYALSIDPCSNYTNSDIHAIMKYVFDRMDTPNLEISYVIEQKKANNQRHLHCYVNCTQKQRLIECLRLGFSNLSYHETDIFDLNGWKNYLTKDGATITTIKNQLN